MQPARAVSIFIALSAAVVMLLQIGPVYVNAADEAAPIKDIAECTMGSCPRAITQNENGARLTYGIDAVITLKGLQNPEMLCGPNNALQTMRSAFADRPQLSYKAARRGSCILTAENFRAEILVSRFR